MKDGNVKGCFVFGQNFAVGGPHVKMARDGLRNLDWLVVLDAYEIETADRLEARTASKPEECGTEVFFIPSRAGRREGRLLHPDPAHAAVARQGRRAAW